MIAHRAVLHWLMMVVLLLMPVSARAQQAGQANDLDGDQLPPQWLIDVRADIRARFTDKLGNDRADVRWWTPLQPRFRVDAWFNEAYFGDVTDLATWSIFPADCGTLVAPGVFAVKPWANVRVRAEWNGQVSETLFHTLDESFYVEGPADEGAGRGILRANAVPTSRIQQGVERSIGQLVNVLPNQTIVKIAGEVGRTTFKDGTGDDRYDNGPQEAGWHSATLFSGRTIIVQPSYAIELKGIGEGASISLPNGLLKDSVKRAVHELLHGLVSDRGWGDGDRDNYPAGDPRNFEGFHEFGDVVQAAFQIHQDRAPKNDAEAARLRSRLALIKRWYDRYAKGPGELKDKVRELLEELEMEDRNGDGMPDFIEEMLRQMGLNPADWVVNSLDPVDRP